MILLNGSEIIENVRIDKKGEVRIPDFPPLYVCEAKLCDYSNQPKYFKQQFCQLCKNRRTLKQDRQYISTVLPFIDIPNLNEGQWNYCEIGYFDIKNSAKNYSQIKLGNITILDVLIRKTLYSAPSYLSMGRYGQENDKIFYSYKININIHQNQSVLKHCFLADDLIERDGWNKWNRTQVTTMKHFFTIIIPLLNEYITLNKPIELINFDYLDDILPKAPDYVFCHPLFSIEIAMKLIYYIEVEDTHIEKIIRFGKNMKGCMNFYMADLVNSILGTNLKYDNETNTSYSILTNIPKKYSETNETTKRYLSCLLYLGIAGFYDEDRANNEYLIRVPDDGLKTTQSRNNSRVTNLNKDFEKIYNFIYGMEATHFQDGLYRAGRDDREWKELFYNFPINSDFMPNEKLILKINDLLEIKLKYNEKNNLEKSYSFYEVYDNDYIAGMTEGKLI